MNRQTHFTLWDGLLLTGILLITAMFCISLGSVSIPLSDIITIIRSVLTNSEIPSITGKAILLSVRIPRIICVALIGASLSICGTAMQGLLRNPLADGSTLGVSAGASLGAVIALAFNITLPVFPFGGPMILAMLFAFGSLLLILTLAYALDKSLATHSIILIGVIFSMFASSLMSLVISFSGEKIKSITFWTMGSLSGSNYTYALILAFALFFCSVIIVRHARELNAFAIGEENAANIGVNVRQIKLAILITVSILIGVCVSIGGTIAFVGLVTPHMARMLFGPNHRRLLPVSLYFGAIFLLLADLIARTILRPIELSIGVVTSLFGAAAFVLIFYRSRKGKTGC
ncbi:MAG: iron ABC transporter permease [Clostridia bacterium]|nr:iron ABC transporter permease [Clostridia bacterium]